jgi:hypothetical protein
MTREPPCCHAGQAQSHFLCCDARKSVHDFSKVNSSLYVLLCHRIPPLGYNSTLRFLSQLLRFPHRSPSYTLWFRRYRHISPAHPTIKLTRTFLISQQVVPYQRRGDTCCPSVAIPKNRSLADSSKTNHIPWKTEPSPPFQGFLKP